MMGRPLPAEGLCWVNPAPDASVPMVPNGTMHKLTIGPTLPFEAIIAERNELRREVERLSLYENLATEYGLSVFAESAQVIEELRREVEALRADAERYRWLRSCKLWPSSDTEYNVGLCVDMWDDDGCGTQVVGDELDAAIDTARASTDEGAGK